ncbi:hypothetical protein [Micromonospora zhanjiangensis]|uniref:DUF4129 domain-containing protein n=1 Tax=Micromonospora zhanjiangensis TaxID=1522057 RepID=A0ABV8KRS0_9ACTN
MSVLSSIDDLLQHDEDDSPDRPRRRRRTGAGAWVGAVAAAAGLTAVTVVGLRFASLELPMVEVFAGWLAVLVVRRVAVAVAPPPVRTGGSGRRGEEDGHYRWSTRDALRGAVNPWERVLGWTEGKPDRFAEKVLPRLGELVDERLRQRHGLTRESDPTRARELLGEHLWSFLTVRPRRGPGPRDWAAVVAQLEKL